VTLGIFAYKGQRDPNLLIRSQEVYVLKVGTAPVVLPVRPGVLMETSIFSREVKIPLIASNAGEVIIARASRFWFPVLVACTAHLALLTLLYTQIKGTMHQ
jgi:hypothetical protein